jgi:periplasmic divalent cation tolerance protein
VNRRASAVVIVYVTTPSRAVAERLAKKALDLRLAACANILGPSVSVYKWKGHLKREREFVLLLKTRKSLSRRLIETVVPLHPYETPCFLVITVSAGYEPFLRWVGAETASAKRGRHLPAP